jgi:hypothetical protein
MAGNWKTVTHQTISASQPRPVDKPVDEFNAHPLPGTASI